MIEPGVPITQKQTWLTVRSDPAILSFLRHPKRSWCASQRVSKIGVAFLVFFDLEPIVIISLNGHNRPRRRCKSLPIGSSTPACKQHVLLMSS